MREVSKVDILDFFIIFVSFQSWALCLWPAQLCSINCLCFLKPNPKSFSLTYGSWNCCDRAAT